jgi:superfamily II RNA helicase
VLGDKIATCVPNLACTNSADHRRRLRLAISDQNLELLPDYEQRIAVLQDLQFIDVNSTVLLKGRVACEVRRPMRIPASSSDAA